MLFVHTRAVRVIIGALSLMIWVSLAQAEEPPAGSPLTLREAVRLAQDRNPDLQTFGFKLRAQDARTQQAGLRPAPELSIEVENVLGSGETKGTDVAETTFALSQVIELGGKRDARIAVSQFGREAISVERQAAQLDVLAEVARRFIHVAADQQQIALTREATDLSRKTVEAVERRVLAARSPDVELYRARTALIRAEIELRHSEHELLASRRKLAAMWGEPEAKFSAVQADLYTLPAPASFDALVARMQANPDFTRFISETRLRDAEIRMAQTRRSTDIQLSGGVRRLQESDDHAFVLGLSIPLFTGRQAAPAIAEAEALRGQVNAERTAAFVKARAQVYELYQELLHSIAEVGTLKRDVLPQMAKALKDTEYAYDRGRYSYLELVDGQRAYLDTQRALIEAATNAQTLQAEIERLTGEPLAVKNP